MNPAQRYQTAVTHHRQDRLAQAEALYRELLALPGLDRGLHVDVTHLLGVLCHQSGRSAEAIGLIEAAVQMAPRNADFLNNLGLALRATGQLQQAIASYQRGLQLTPKDLDLHTNLGNAYRESNQYAKAAASYRQVLRATPQDTKIQQALCHSLHRLGMHSQLQGRYAESAACYQEAIRYQTRDAALYYNLGNAQRELGQAAQAAASYRQALALTPDDADIHNNLGNVLREQGQLQQAIDCYRQALALNPRLFHARVHLIHQLQHACDWQEGEHGLDAQIRQVRDWLVQEPEAQISPFAFLAMPGTTPHEQRLCADRWLQNRYGSLFEQASATPFVYSSATTVKSDKGMHNAKLRIGYLSADFRLHPLASLISELLELHDRSRVHVTAYSYGHDDKSQARRRLQQAVDRFVDIRAMTMTEAAQRIYADGIDILVDLTGFTLGSRSGIAALRPAPINVSWLGFPGTMGSFPTATSGQQALFDYLISDATITPLANPTPDSGKTSADHALLAGTGRPYAEKLALLPCYQPNDRKRPIAKAPSREQCGLPEDAFVFCCFNQTFKLSPALFTIWMRLLAAVPGSVLWLLECNPLAKQNLLLQAQQRGIDPQRLVFAPRVDMAQHLARQPLADLFLDTLPYNAHTTASDALWMGLPVLTCKGESFASRVAASLLTAAGLPELVTETLQEYERMALELARQPQRLGDLRVRLQENRANEKQASADQGNWALFDTPRFTRGIEAAYQHMWQRHQQRLAPASFEIGGGDGAS